VYTSLHLMLTRAWRDAWRVRGAPPDRAGVAQGRAGEGPPLARQVREQDALEKNRHKETRVKAAEAAAAAAAGRKLLGNDEDDKENEAKEEEDRRRALLSPFKRRAQRKLNHGCNCELLNLFACRFIACSKISWPALRRSLTEPIFYSPRSLCVVHRLRQQCS